MSLATSCDITRHHAIGSGWRKMSFDRRRCGREPRWRERERKRKTGGSRKRKGFPLQCRGFCIPQQVSRAPPLLSNNRFSVLEITEPKVDEDAQEPDTPALLPTKPCKLRQPKWEKRIKRKLVIHLLELDVKCIMLPIHLKTMDTMEETSTEAMVDTGATGDFIDQDFVTQAKLPTCKLSQLIQVYNVDGTLNEAGSICEVVNMIMTYDRHSERILLAVTHLGKQSMILGFTWLDKHNPEIDFHA